MIKIQKMTYYFKKIAEVFSWRVAVLHFGGISEFVQATDSTYKQVRRC